MTTRTITRSLALLAGAAALVAACGGGTPTAAPATNAPVATPTAAPLVTQAPIGTSGPGLTFDTSSFHADVELEDLFPDEINGEELQALSMSGPEIMGEGGSPELAAVLTALNKTPDDLSAAFGFAGGVSIVAFRIEGAAGGSILPALMQAFSDEAEGVITDTTIGGKAVKKITPTDPDDEVGYVYAYQDVIFLVAPATATDAVLAEAISKLP